MAQYKIWLDVIEFFVINFWKPYEVDQSTGNRVDHERQEFILVSVEPINTWNENLAY